MKVKINNIDEFCEALKAGYLLRSEDVHIQLKENMFYFFAEGLGNVSDPVHIFQYEKPDPLKIECGKQYETRDHVVGGYSPSYLPNNSTMISPVDLEASRVQQLVDRAHAVEQLMREKDPHL